MKKFFILSVVFLLSIGIAFTSFVLLTRTSDNSFHNSFTASLVDKYELLSSITEERIIFIGGSSVPFGLKSDQIEKSFGYPVVDFGVYATIGTKAMMEIALPQLHSGDIVVLCPELNQQTYSTYFNPDVLWEAGSENVKMFSGLSIKEKEEMAFRWFKFRIRQKKLAGTEISEDILYSRSNFNEYGDISFVRTKNIMPGGVDSSNLISLDGLMDDEFFSFVKDFALKAQKRGATVVFAFSPINELAVRFSDEDAHALEKYIADTLGIPILGTIKDVTYPSEYFYNTNYHLNDSGADIHTETMIRLLEKFEAKELAAIDDLPENSTTQPVYSEPVESAQQSTNPTHDQTNSPSYEMQYVRVERIGGILYVAGLTEKGLEMESLSLPEQYNNEPINGIIGNGLQSQSLKELIIPKDYFIFDQNSFAGCPNLSHIVLMLDDPSSSSIPLSGLFDGCADGLIVSVPKASYTAYLSDYNWRIYKDFLRGDN